MDEHVYKIIELTGSSSQSIEEAIKHAVERASHSLREMRWFEVVQIRGNIDNGMISHWQVTLKIGFNVEEIFTEKK